MNNPQCLVDGQVGGPPPEELDPSTSGEPREPGAYRLCLAVRPTDPFVRDVPKHVRVRITPAFASWALQTRSIVEQGMVPAAGYEDQRPVWLSCVSDDAAGEDDDERFLGRLATARVHVSRDGVTWRTVLEPGEVHLETELLCFEELTDLVLRAAAQSSSRESVPMHIAQCIPAALISPPAPTPKVRRGLRALLHRTQRLWPTHSEPHAPSPHKEVER